ncbi:LuxR C-terminal-related transcriptional regulator [Streptomyces sp. 4N124]|uniref:LuxR C-terminal-related transcriptional regulator n=1 Tax=Streptomyces sp. 4N124 TaxID=3457420 RepID=UPI003FD09BF9
MVSVLVVTDQSLQRLALRMLLAAEPDLSVVGEAASAAEAVHLSASLRPDVVLVDGRPAQADGIETVRRLAEHTPRTLVLTPAGDEGYAYTALHAGADGFVLEDAALDELVSAIRVVAAGDAVITPGLTRALIDAVRQKGTVYPLRRASTVDALTARERDILVAVASGRSNAEIAQWLSIAPTTVKSHVSHILAKIGARARVQAVAFAYESGLVRPAA